MAIQRWGLHEERPTLRIDLNRYSAMQGEARGSGAHPSARSQILVQAVRRSQGLDEEHNREERKRLWDEAVEAATEEDLVLYRSRRSNGDGTYTYGTKRGSTGELLFETLHIFGGILKMAGQAGWRREGRAATQSSAIIDEAARVVRGRGSATWGRSGAGRGGTHSYYRDWPFDWR